MSDVDRLSSFCNSYMLGMKLTRGDQLLHNHTINSSSISQTQIFAPTSCPDLRGLFSSSFDAKIAPEHLLRLCLEHDDKFILHKSTCAYNFYKALSVLLSVIVFLFIMLSLCSVMCIPCFVSNRIQIHPCWPNWWNRLHILNRELFSS